MVTTTLDVATAALNAKQASSKLARSARTQRNQALLAIADGLEKKQSEIIAANQADLQAARQLVAQGQLTEASFNRLKLDAVKLSELATGIRQIAEADDPLEKVTLARELDTGLRLYRVTCPIGVVGVIFESRPDALPQIASLCIKSGNAAILKGGSEAQKTNLKLFQVIADALEAGGLPAQTVTLLESRKDVEELLKADHLIDLIIPRGSNELVKHVQDHTRIPVLGHAEGVCHIYIDKAADHKKALSVTVDAKVQYPAACNAAETLLVHKDIAEKLLPEIAEALIQNKVELRADKRCRDVLGREDIVEAKNEDWDKEYCDLILSVKMVDSAEEAIDHINQYGSGHTDTIVTDDNNIADQFCQGVNSAGVYVNASTRFADGFRYGFGAEVGISTGKLHPRGPVGVEGLVTYKYKLVGQGHVVGDYVGKTAKKFIHKEISP